MTPLPLNIARCPGRGLTDLLTRRPYTDLYCIDCPRHIQHKADLAQWISDCRPRIFGGDPALPGARMMPPPREQWVNGVCPVRAEDWASPRPTVSRLAAGVGSVADGGST